MSKLNIQATPVFRKLSQANRRFVLSVGSSRSSKTYSMLQWIIVECYRRKGEGIYISVVRASFPSLRRTVYREFVDLMKELNLYDESRHNKTEHLIEIAGNFVEFFSLSDSQKVRGAKRNHLYLNECNEVDWESAQQLFLRTTERVFMDENPSDIWHWSYKMKDRDDVDYIHSTYKDNPFLTEATIKQIESYKDLDENFYRVYALGLPGFATTTIYTHWKEYKDSDLIVKDEEGKPHPLHDTIVYGLDVGYGHAMALTKIHVKDDTVWVEEVIYRSGLTSNDLISLMNDLAIDKDIDIWVDAAAPAMVEDLRRAGYAAKSADKSVKEGIDMIRSKRLYINTNSTNLISEIRRYQWKTKNEQVIYEPVKVNDDLVDSMRYAIWNYYRQTKRIEDNDIDIEIIDL
jgi:phage terminase large subunit